MDKLSDIVAIESLSEEDRANYDRNMRNEFDIRTEKLMIREAAFSEGKAEGKAEGIAEGKAETRLEVVRKLIAAGVDMSVVIDSTGLSQEELVES